MRDAVDIIQISHNGKSEPLFYVMDQISPYIVDMLDVL